MKSKLPLTLLIFLTIVVSCSCDVKENISQDINSTTTEIYSSDSSKRLKEDTYAKFKYDSTTEIDSLIIERVSKLAEKYNVSMTEVSLAWLLTKVTAPVVGVIAQNE